MDIHLIRWVGNEEGNSPYPCWATADATTSADGVQKIKGLYGNPHGNYWVPEKLISHYAVMTHSKVVGFGALMKII